MWSRKQARLMVREPPCLLHLENWNPSIFWVHNVWSHVVCTSLLGCPRTRFNHLCVCCSCHTAAPWEPSGSIWAFSHDQNNRDLHSELEDKHLRNAARCAKIISFKFVSSCMVGKNQNTPTWSSMHMADDAITWGSIGVLGSCISVDESQLKNCQPWLACRLLENSRHISTWVGGEGGAKHSSLSQSNYQREVSIQLLDPWSYSQIGSSVAKTWLFCPWQPLKISNSPIVCPIPPLPEKLDFCMNWIIDIDCSPRPRHNPWNWWKHVLGQ